MHRRALLFAAVLSALLLPLAGSSATPNGGTVSEASPSVTWSGGFMAPTGSSDCSGANAATCDNFSLTVAPPAYAFQVVIALQPFAGDWDLKVYDASGALVGSSGNGPGQTEYVVLKNVAAGTYRVAASPFAPVPSTESYTASATLQAADGGAGGAAGSDHLTFADYGAPAPLGQSSGEPSLGADWKTGNTMFQASLQTLRVSWNDCASPAAPTWKDVSWPGTSAASLDPIGYCDHATNRWFSSQLSGTTSLAAYTDDDGASWVQTEGGPLNGGVDHQTYGGGPYAPPLSGTPVYPNAVYYCSQDLVAALCARSDTGGATFNPAVPIYTSECGGLHGHVKVAPDGTVYVPNRGCGQNQAVVVSEDNGVTWSVRPIPQSGPGDWDPSVGIGADGTVYFAYGDSDGRPRVAVSHDKGRTWTNVRDISGSFTVAHTAFPVAVAGDADRAAVAYLGTSYAGAGAFGDDPKWPGEWHLYVAETTDGGSTWTTVDAAPNDPVQRGTICAGGFNGCGNGTRNLLDFMDITVDAVGHVLVGYPDGCVDACITGPPGTFASVATIARQVSGKRLFAKYDVVGVPAAPAVSVKGSSGPPPANVVSWQEPDDHGSAITGYRVYRNGSLIASPAPDARSYSDASAPAGATYRVTAVNAQGEGAACGDHAAEAAPQQTTQSPCDESGVTVLTDPSGDSLDSDPGHDVQSLSIAEPRSIGLGNVEFLLKVASLASLPKNTTWPVLFHTPDGTDHWVRMKTDALGAVSFGYGTGASYTGTQAGAADPQSGYAASGAIRIVVPRTALGVKAGDALTDFLTRISVNGVAVNLTPDNMPDSLARTGSYTVAGNENCVVPLPDLSLAPGDVGFYELKGKDVTLVATVHNTGTAAASDVKVKFEVDGQQVGNLQTIPTIAPGSTGRASVVWSKAPNGTHTVTVTADPGSTIAESSESNNSASKTVAVKGGNVG